MQESAERDFQDYGRTLETVTSFKYMGRVLTEVDDDWPVVVENLNKSRKSWALLTRILVWEGANPRVSGTFFRALVHAVLIFWSEMWVRNPRMGRALGMFQNGVAMRITGINTGKLEEGGWEYPPLMAAMEEAGFAEIGVYILKWHNTFAQ